MSEDFFTQLNIPEPNINLGVGSGTAATQTANIMLRYEEAVKEWKPELCIVVGDVTSTMACAIVAKKEWIKVAHVEGGIRSNDEMMPEEINRLVTDAISNAEISDMVKDEKIDIDIEFLSLAEFEADDNAERRDLYAPFEGNRTPSNELNDAPNSQRAGQP